MPETYPLYVAFVWHMHQPYYKVPGQNAYGLPWVRLHATKDYLHMVEVLEPYPNVHVTINMVPSLVEQIQAYADGQAVDRMLALSLETDWSDDDRAYILNLGFSISWDNIIRRYPRYAELLDRRPQALASLHAFSDQDTRDLIAWFHLAWIDPNMLERDPELKALVKKGRYFTTENLKDIAGKHRAICGMILPAYRQIVKRGQIELSASPYYHPILPLLIDNKLALPATPSMTMPAVPFSAQEDAAWQLQRAAEYHAQMFGERPRGLWPSEGSVSPEILPLVRQAGFNWLASDEAILGKSLGADISDRDAHGFITQPRQLYRAYGTLDGNQPGPAIIFRDHQLSDRIGFTYKGMPGRQAAEDLVVRLQIIRQSLEDSSYPYLVPIILDGENCWEWYEHNGDIFLNDLYRRLNDHPNIRCVTVSEYLAQHPTRQTLARLATGSWIRVDLTTWIGDPEHNIAWTALARTRADLVNWAAHHPEATAEVLAQAWEAVYVAEGSDWFWWYSKYNSSDQDALFDETFRANLRFVYEVTGQAVPGWVERPIDDEAAGPRSMPPKGPISPTLGASSLAPSPDWDNGGVLLPAGSTGTMQKSTLIIDRLRYGIGDHTLFMRLEMAESLAEYTATLYMTPNPGGAVNQLPRQRSADTGRLSTDGLGWAIELAPGQARPFLYRALGGERWELLGPLMAASSDRVLEVAVPLGVLGIEAGGRLRLTATAARAQAMQDALPTAELSL